MSRRTTEILVGLFVMLGLVALVFVSLKAANLTSFSIGSATYPLSARFDNIGGLKARAPVRSAGVDYALPVTAGGTARRWGVTAAGPAPAPRG